MLDGIVSELPKTPVGWIALLALIALATLQVFNFNRNENLKQQKDLIDTLERKINAQDDEIKKVRTEFDKLVKHNIKLESENAAFREVFQGRDESSLALAGKVDSILKAVEAGVQRDAQLVESVDRLAEAITSSHLAAQQ